MAAGLFLKKLFKKTESMESKKLFEVTDKTGYKRYILAYSKYEALERIRANDDYKDSVLSYKVKSKNF